MNDVPGPPPPRLVGERVVLREMTEADLPRLTAAVVDPASAWATTVPSPYGPLDAAYFLECVVRDGWARNSGWTFAFEARGESAAAGAYAGSIDLRSTGTGRAEIGFLTHPDSRGRGLTTDAARTILRWGLGPMGLTSVEWRARVGNTASLRIAWSCGFSADGLIREGMEQRGVRLDCHVGSLLAGEPIAPREPWEDWLRGVRAAPQR